MTPQLTNTTDALTRGELQFAIVETFNANAEPTPDCLNFNGQPVYGDGSRDMTGTVRLMDGMILPFAYIDGRFAVREDDGVIHFDEEGYSPAWGGFGMSWPFESFAIMVDIEDGRVRRWTWPGVVMADYYRISDHRYLEIPDYDGEVQFPGLHCVIDVSRLSPGWAKEILENPELRPNFPGAAVYIGHHADDFLTRADAPFVMAVFGWDKALGKSFLKAVIATSA